MIIKSIPSQWLIEEEHRLDCGPYVKGSIETRKILEALKCHKSSLIEVTKGGMGGMYHVGQDKIVWAADADHGMPFLRSADILRADLSYQLFISREQVKNNYLFQCPEGATLITRSGTIGRMVYARKEMKNVAISQDVLKVVPDQDLILPGYLYAFLSSKFGIPLVVGGTFGSIIVHIEAENIANLPVPRLDEVEKRAHDFVQQSADLLTIYQKNIREATHLFLESVGLEDITAAEWNGWGSDLGFKKILKGTESLRALNFNPRFDRLCEKIKQGPWKPLGEICLSETLKSGPRFKRIDAMPEYAYQLIGQKQIFWLQPEGRWISKNSVGEEVLVTEGTILVAAQGTLGESELFCRSEYITGKALERAYSQHFLRVISNEGIMERGALYAFMRSEIAFRMLRSISTGSKLQDFHYSFLPELPVPYPPSDVRMRCHQLIVDAYKAREKAVDLENEARSLVEKAIEGAAQ